MMHAYHEAYLKEVVETQGKLFSEVSEYAPGIDVADFIETYMASKTREYIDEGQAYVNTLSARELWEYFCKTDGYKPVEGETIEGFCVDWIGRFYAYFQWYYNMASRKVVETVPIEFVRAAYPGLHDLELDLAVCKVGERIAG